MLETLQAFFFKTFIRQSWFLVISDLPERKKYHTFENLILTDKLFAIMVSKVVVTHLVPNAYGPRI